MMREEPRTFIKEIILENFMSYSYARIPFKRGLNIICGPNGSGKSSILLALSVALGQTYTERSRKLSDLIRRGEDMGRVSVVFDNSSENGGRYIPNIETDSFVLSRYLKQDGTYWHEANYETVTKGEVNRLLSQLTINPDNMLIIMHQNMIVEFAALDAQQRLKSLEEAVGLSEYRERILRARENLSHSLSEEESIKAMLEDASETLDHWEEEYQRYLRKMELMERKELLERKYAWSKWSQQKEKFDNLKAKLEKIGTNLEEISRDIETTEEKQKKSKTLMDKLEYEVDSLYRDLIRSERRRGGTEARLEIADKLEELEAEGLEEMARELGGGRGKLEKKLEETSAKIEDFKTSLVDRKEERAAKRETYVDHRVRRAILGLRRELLEKEASGLKSNLRRLEGELRELRVKAEERGIKILSDRRPREILEDIRITNAQLSNVTDVSSDAERMYKSYKDLLEELEEKAEEAAENRRRALKELESRKEMWRKNLRELLRNVRETYRNILKRVDALGDVRMVNVEDIDDAGLELRVGFRGTEPLTLDAYTQSGGERSTSCMCFLLALQQYIKSPIRGIDEFELHMDPKNRQTMMKQLLEMMKETDLQYLVITPGRLIEAEEVPNVVAVQNAAGSTEVKVAT